MRGVDVTTAKRVDNDKTVFVATFVNGVPIWALNGDVRIPIIHNGAEGRQTVIGHILRGHIRLPGMADRLNGADNRG